MNVLLINPPYSKVYKKVETAEGINPPLGLAYIAGYIRSKGINVNILDAHALGIGLNDLAKHLPKDFDLIGVPSMTPSLNTYAETLKICKQINPNCLTVSGGSHISAEPVNTFDMYPELDFGIKGEAEITFYELVRALENSTDLSSIPGLVFRKDGKVVQNINRPYIDNLDILPLPAFDLLPMHVYCLPLHHVGFGKKVPTKPFSIMFTSRGCPFNCTFCASKVVWTRRVRYRSSAHVLAEIDELVLKYGVKVIDFCDDIFTLNVTRLHEILDGIIERNYNLHFNCLSRVDTITYDIAKKMKKAGCYLIRFGVESGSQLILDAMKKETTPDKIRNAFKIVKRLGIATSASFTIGHPGETKDTFRETINLAKEIDPTMVHFFTMIPLVGTELNEIAKREGLIEDTGWENWVQMPDKPVLRTKELSIDDIVKLRKQAYREFYFRPTYIFKSIARIRTFEQIKLYFNGLRAVISLTKEKAL